MLGLLRVRIRARARARVRVSVRAKVRVRVRVRVARAEPRRLERLEQLVRDLVRGKGIPAQPHPI